MGYNTISNKLHTFEQFKEGFLPTVEMAQRDGSIEKRESKISGRP
ncbi:MAG: hypothetical protein OEV42_18520 [Deltaproteobacteria bacterium]|nr:hypothetical protein [Deltaproteobacteria bacterium]